MSEYAKFCDNVDKNVLKLIAELKPRFWFIENPRGGLRKMDFMQGLPRYARTVILATHVHHVVARRERKD